MTDGTTDRSRRRRLLSTLMGLDLPRALSDPSLHADLLAEAHAAGPDSLLNHDMLDYLAELQNEANSSSSTPELFFSTDRVVIVPGLMGSALADTRPHGRGLVWVSPLILLADRLGLLRLGPYDGTEDDHDPSVRIEPVGPLPLFYDLLRLTLEVRRYNTEFFPFDWRRDLDIAAWRLSRRLRELGNDPRPLHLIAHSQGALVARRALQILGSSLSRRIVSRLILLGPANFGSFSSVLALAGGGDTLSLLRRLAVEPHRGFQPVLASMSGLYQLIPWDPQRAPWLAEVDLQIPESWGPHTPIDSTRLRRFLGWGRSIDTSFFDDRTTLILGDYRAEPTPGGVTLGSLQPSAIPSYALPGDGTIPHSLAVLPGVRTLLASGAEHSMLAASRTVLKAVRDLLVGRDPQLPETSSDPHAYLPPHSQTVTSLPSLCPPSRRTLQSASTSSLPRLNGRFLFPPSPDSLNPSPNPLPSPTQPDTSSNLPDGRIYQAASPVHPHASPEPPPPGTEDLNREIVLGSNNLLPFHFLRDGDRLGRAVVKLQRADGATGTGFLVAPDILLTNHHVLPDSETAATTRALANFESRPPTDSHGRAAVVALEPDTLFVTNPNLDFTFCGVPGLDYLGIVPLDRDSLAASRSHYVNIVQHPGGRTKEVALQDNRVVRSDNLVIQYACDTEPGSSGSPVFDNHWTLVALHHASVRTDADGYPNDANPAAPASGRYLNEGIRLSAIAAWLETDDAERQIAAEPLARLRSIFLGLDPQIGFFGGLGRGGNGLDPAQTVAELYRSDGSELDLGYWDLGGPGRPAHFRRLDVARILASLRVDVWCLPHTDTDDLHGLAHELHSHYGLLYHVEPGNPPFRFLYRDLAGLSIKPLHPAPTPFPAGFRLQLDRAGKSLFPLDVFPLASPINWPQPRNPFSPPHDTLILSGKDPRALLQAPDLTAPNTLLASGPSGGFALILVPGSLVDRVFVAPGLLPVNGPANRIVPAHNRQLPSATAGLGASLPLALRISLRPPEAHDSSPLPDDSTPSSAVPNPSPKPPPTEDALLAALRPFLSQLLAELRQNSLGP